MTLQSETYSKNLKGELWDLLGFDEVSRVSRGQPRSAEDAAFEGAARWRGAWYPWGGRDVFAMKHGSWQ